MTCLMQNMQISSVSVNPEFYLNFSLSETLIE